MAPKIIDKWLHVTQDGYDGVVKYSTRSMAPRAIFIHIQEGSNWGSWQWFHQVQASSTVLLGKNGDIWRIVPEDKAPWTNGDVKSPTARGTALMNKFGWDPNLYSLTIETEGFSGHTVPELQMQSLVWQVQDWQKRYGLTNADVYRHADVNQVTRPGCPGDALFNELMRRLESGTPQPEPSPKPEKPRTFNLRFDTYIRTSPGFWDNTVTEEHPNGKSNVIKLLRAGTTGEIISGPKTVDGVEFYDLRIKDFGTGWLQDQVLHTLEIK